MSRSGLARMNDQAVHCDPVMNGLAFLKVSYLFSLAILIYLAYSRYLVTVDKVNILKMLQ